MSGNASRTRGRSRELRYRDHLRQEGWWCERVDCATDLVAARKGERLHFLQVKSTQTPWAHFGPADRQVFLEECRRAGAVGALVWWPKRGKPEWIDEASWP